MNLSLHIRRGARYWGPKAAVMHNGCVLTYAALYERACRLANGLIGMGLRPGDRVAIRALNCTQLVEIECALYMAGLTKAALNPRYTEHEVAQVMADCTPSVFIGGAGFTGYGSGSEGFGSVHTMISLVGGQPGYLDYEEVLAKASVLEPEVTVSTDEVAVLHFSSGSTGKIKAAMQTFGNRLASLRKFLAGSDVPLREGDRLAMLGPMTHATGMLIQPTLYGGGTIVVFDKFEVEPFLAAVQALRITHVFMVPAMINMVLAHPAMGRYDLSSLRSLTYGAAPMAPARIIEAWKRLGPILSQGYGGSEMTSGVARLSIRDHADAIARRPERLASCGRPHVETDVRVVDELGREVRGDGIGEVVVRGEDVFKGYWGAPDLSDEVLVDGWFHTGDLARVDDEGFIYLVDRKKDMIISGGFNVYPTEVETVLYQHPAIYEACVIGVPNTQWGESVKAVVCLRPGATAGAEELMAFCRERMADYKCPRTVDFAAELPKNASGKVARKLVREPYWQGSDRRVN